ncbi:MAG: Si-specific NAD(P)(+) transhydrogenase [Capsulimonadales bacterium]|nr:Si-specific NAD(P)(+) transhydrogenase [Capsulimonadales bacterium]
METARMPTSDAGSNASGETPRHYDLVVIGSGPAGEKGAAQAAYFGKRVAVIEKEPYFGGAAANTGTLPSKTLRETALYLSGFRQRGLYGIEANLRDRATVQDFLHRERLVKEGERERIRRNFERHRIDIYRGIGRFVDPHTVAVDGPVPTTLQADRFLIATGSRPYRPPIYPFDDQGVYDSDEILHLDTFPSSMLVAGGGVIGCEYACIFAALGVQVTLIESRHQILSFLDDEVSERLKQRMEALGIVFRMQDSVTEVITEENDASYRARLASGAVLPVETILVASGRSGNTEELNLGAIGIPLNARGQIVVDEHFRTVVPHIYAAGDVIGFPALASASMEQGRLAMCHAFDLRYKQEMAPILPYGIYTIPEVSVAGITEEDARAQGIDIVVGRASFAQNARGEIIGDEFGFLKLVFRRSDMKLIGTHIIGESATELIHIGLTAMLADADAELFIRTCFNYPTLSEVYKYATYDALGHRADHPETVFE